MRKFFLFLGIAVVVVVAALGGLAWAFFDRFYASPPAADTPAASSALAAQRQDLDYLRTLVGMDRSFSDAHRAEALDRITVLEKSTPLLEPAKLHVAVMQIMALADNGHTHGRIMSDKYPPQMLPVRVARFAEGFFIMRATAPVADLLGGRLLSIDGIPFETVLARLETLTGGQENYRRNNAADYVIVQDMLYGLGIAHDPYRSEWTVQLPSGETLTRTLIAAPLRKGDDFPSNTRWLSTDPAKGMGAEWRTYQPASGRLPVSLQRFDTYFLHFSVPHSCAEYVRIQDIIDTDGQAIQPFLKETLDWLRTHPRCAAIVDLRYDGGGDYTNMWRFTHQLPSLTKRIFVLTDPETFSAAITSTAFLKEQGGNRTTIVGEPVGDRLAFYAEGNGGCLPNSKLCVRYATGKHDYARPCTDWRICFWTNWVYPVRVKTLAPDVPVPLRFADWDTGHDAAYERAVALAR
jgi:hypothetical protein